MEDPNTRRAKALASRLRELAKRYSLSEIARRTGSSRNNVSRYARGHRMPIEFASALVEGLGVNPAWLLAGEGAPWLAESAEQTAVLGGNMLQLVEALNAVTRMRLGALTGKHHLRVLRELNDALKRYEVLREQLNGHTRPIFTDLLARYHSALENAELDRAGELREALMQVQRLSEDKALKLKLTEELAHHAHHEHNPAKSAELQHVLLYESLAARAIDAPTLCERAHNLAMAHMAGYRIGEALRTSQAALDLAGKDALDTPNGRLLDALCGSLQIELGEVRTGLSRLQRHIAFRSEIYHGVSSGLLVRALLLAGVVDFNMARGIGAASASKSARLCQFAVWSEQSEPLAWTLKHAVGAAPDQLSPDSLSAALARALHDALVEAAVRHKREGKSSKARTGHPSAATNVRKFIEEVLYARGATFGTATSAASLLWHTGDIAGALREFEKAREQFPKIDPSRTPDVLVVATHHRNALRLESKQSAGWKPAQEARNFLRRCLAQGYGFLASDGQFASEILTNTAPRLTTA